MKHVLIGLLLVLYVATLAAQQPPMPKQKGFLIGWHQSFDRKDPDSPTPMGGNWPTNYKLPTIALERTLMRYGSVQVGCGASIISHPKNPDYKKLNTQLFAELRYYICLQRGRPTSGIYIGLYADVNRTRWIYRQPQGQVANRKSFENAGPSFGYQHAIGNHLRFNEGVTAVMQSTIRENNYAPSGGVIEYIRTYDQWYSFYWYFKMGYVF
jgi:hypothetical protein